MHIESVTTVLILLNGTVPRSTAGINSAISMLASISPKILTKNIAFMFTNVSGPLSWNFSQDTVPLFLKGAPQFQIDNPIALQKRYLELQGDPGIKERRMESRKTVKAAEQDALEVLVNLFDWLDSLEPQPTTEIPLMARSVAQAAKVPAVSSSSTYPH